MLCIVIYYYYSHSFCDIVVWRMFAGEWVDCLVSIPRLWEEGTEKKEEEGTWGMPGLPHLWTFPPGLAMCVTGRGCGLLPACLQQLPVPEAPVQAFWKPHSQGEIPWAEGKWMTNVYCRQIIVTPIWWAYTGRPVCAHNLCDPLLPYCIDLGQGITSSCEAGRRVFWPWLSANLDTLSLLLPNILCLLLIFHYWYSKWKICMVSIYSLWLRGRGWKHYSSQTMCQPCWGVTEWRKRLWPMVKILKEPLPCGNREEAGSSLTWWKETTEEACVGSIMSIVCLQVGVTVSSNYYYYCLERQSGGIWEELTLFWKRLLLFIVSLLTDPTVTVLLVMMVMGGILPKPGKRKEMFHSLDNTILLLFYYEPMCEESIHSLQTVVGRGKEELPTYYVVWHDIPFKWAGFWWRGWAFLLLGC